MVHALHPSTRKALTREKLASGTITRPGLRALGLESHEINQLLTWAETNLWERQPASPLVRLRTSRLAGRRMGGEEIEAAAVVVVDLPGLSRRRLMPYVGRKDQGRAPSAGYAARAQKSKVAEPHELAPARVVSSTKENHVLNRPVADPVTRHPAEDGAAVAADATAPARGLGGSTLSKRLQLAERQAARSTSKLAAERRKREELEAEVRKAEETLAAAREAHVAEMHALQSRVRTLQSTLEHVNGEQHVAECVELLEERSQLEAACARLGDEREHALRRAVEDAAAAGVAPGGFEGAMAVDEGISAGEIEEITDEITRHTFRLHIVEDELEQRRAALERIFAAPAYEGLAEMLAPDAEPSRLVSLAVLAEAAASAHGGRDDECATETAAR